MGLSKITRDHAEIRQWAESRGAIPSEVASTESDSEPGILRFQFPKSRNRNDDALREISWEGFFEKFDASQLEMVYQDNTASGTKSNFNKFIHPENAEPSKRRSSSSGSATRSTKKTSTSSAKKSRAA